MVELRDLIRRGPWEWEIPTTVRSDMRVPVRIFAGRELLDAIKGDASLDQAVNATTLPGVVGEVMVMPDVHRGYGFPIGGVAATELPSGVISPGAIGYDINCGVRLLASKVEFDRAASAMEELASALDAACPSGVGKGGRLTLNDHDLERVCREGGTWAQASGYGTVSDTARTEEGGFLEGADFSAVSHRARERGRPQMGTLGAGNHFIEVEVVDEIFDDDAARVMGLEEGCLTVMIHCGSRGFGHQICTDYVKTFQKAVKKYGIRLPDRELVCAPLDSPEGQAYESAMRCAANYAFANRQVLAHFAREAFAAALRGRASNTHLHQVYDIAHNMGKTEDHLIDGKRRRVCVHRKGATRAFGPGFRGPPARVPSHRPTGAGAGLDGHGLLGAGGYREEHGVLARLLLPRRRPHHEPPPGQTIDQRFPASTRTRGKGHQDSRRLPPRSRRGGTRRLQGRRRGRRGSGRRRHRPQGRAAQARRRRQGLTAHPRLGLRSQDPGCSSEGGPRPTLLRTRVSSGARRVGLGPPSDSLRVVDACILNFAAQDFVFDNSDLGYWILGGTTLSEQTIAGYRKPLAQTSNIQDP